MEYYNNTLCLEGGWLYKAGIMSKHNYKNLVNRNKINVVRRGCRNTPALIDYESIPERFKETIVEKVGNPYKVVNNNQFENKIQSDLKADDFFKTYILQDGRNLPEENRIEYYTNTIVLNALHEVLQNRKSLRKALGGSTKGLWEKLSNTINSIDVTKYPHTLPKNQHRLRDKYNKYIKFGYESLIHSGFCNQNPRKVNDNIERLLLSIYVMENRPFATWVQDYYLQFLSGTIDIVDCETGELFDRTDFFNSEGLPIIISESTAWNYIKRPDNQILVNKLRKSGINFETKEMPFNHRHRPNYSLSKISFDDRALPRKSIDGWVNAYYAYDPMSECVIASSYSMDKDTELVLDCFRDMYKTLVRYDLPWPAEAEVEHHLMSGIKDDLNALFAFVHFCPAGKSRSKRAEHGIRLKKYGTEKRLQDNIGRWSNRHDAYQVNTDKVVKLTSQQAIEDDKQSIAKHNHSLHGDQVKFKGKTRWQVLMENTNPDLSQPQKRIILKYIGNVTATSIRNNDFVRLQYADYAIETTNILARLTPNNYDVQAYWLQNEDGTIPETYLYQGDKYLCQAIKYETYNEAIAERTDKDDDIRTKHAVRQANMRKDVKNGINKKVTKVSIESNFDYENIEPEIVKNAELPVLETENSYLYDDSEFDQLRAIDNL